MMPTTQENEALTILTVAEVADMVRVSRTTIWRWCDTGKLKAFQAGRNWRIHRDSVEQLMVERVAKAAAD